VRKERIKHPQSSFASAWGGFGQVHTKPNIAMCEKKTFEKSQTMFFFIDGRDSFNREGKNYFRNFISTQHFCVCDHLNCVWSMWRNVRRSLG
jgi:hypothetical protein